MGNLSNLPPGCSNADIERAYGGDEPPCCQDCQKTVCDRPQDCPIYKAFMEEQRIQAENYAEAMADAFRESQDEEDHYPPELPKNNHFKV